MPDTYDVFLSYQDEDRDWTRRLADALLEAGLRVWYAETEIKPGDSVVDRVEAGLRGSTYVVFITPRVVSNWTAVELGAALALHKPLIPVVAEGSPWEDIPGPIRLRKQLTKGDPAVVADEIIRTVVRERNGTSTSGIDSTAG